MDRPRQHDFGDGGNAIAATWQEELNTSVEFDRQSYSTFRPNLVNRTATGVWFRGCCSSSPLTWDLEQWHSALTAPGGYNAGVEYPIASFTAMEKNKFADDPQKLEDLTVAWLDFMFENAFSTGIAVTPAGSLYNPNEIISWNMRQGCCPSNDQPEWIFPAQR